MSEIPRYWIGSGYHWEISRGPDKFFQTWIENISKLKPMPSKVMILADSGARPPVAGCWIPCDMPVEIIHCKGNLGNCHMLLHGIKQHEFSGWTGAVCATAWAAYNDEADFVFFEQDVLAFGDVIQQMYKEIGNAGIIFGKCDWMPCEQSLFLVRHAYIPTFVRLFSGEGPQNCEENLGEHIFLRLAKRHPDKWFQFDIQYGRNRPIDFDAKTYYAQKWTDDELNELRKRGMI